MISLDDVGRELFLSFETIEKNYEGVARVQMVIKAPRGTMALLDNKYISPDTHCKAIKSFIEEHKND